MRHSPRILIASTHSDDSLNFFSDRYVTVAFFEDETKRFEDTIRATDFDIIYIRDPFNTGTLPLGYVLPLVELITSRHPDAYYVDRTSDAEGLLIEDKWIQYQIWKDMMPRTFLAGANSNRLGQFLAKKRISARSRDIVFEPDESALNSEWILQERLTITEELRVYALFGQVVRLASKRQSHRHHEPTRVTGIRSLNDQEYLFAKELVSLKTDLDFVGFDIAVTQEGLRLIEVNRSPQFNRYNQLSGTNLVAGFWNTLNERLD